MRRVVRKKAGRKSQVSVAAEAAILDLDARVAMIQALIPLGLEKIGEELKGSVEELVGPRYQRTGEDRRYYRWGSGQGSVYLADQKVRVRVPRVRDVHANEEIRLPVYGRLQEPHAGDRQLLGRLLRGLGCRNYAETAALVPEVFGLSASTVSSSFAFCGTVAETRPASLVPPSDAGDSGITRRWSGSGLLRPPPLNAGVRGCQGSPTVFTIPYSFGVKGRFRSLLLFVRRFQMNRGFILTTV